jgi:cell division ATPase FtsA
MGAGTTTIATYSAGRFVHASGFAVGGQHVTMDLARGLVHALRMPSESRRYMAPC